MSIGIFDPNAVIEAWNSGPMGFLFTILAPFIFLAAGLISSLISRTRVYILVILLVLLVDVVIAYKITKARHETRWSTGAVKNEWEATMVFQDENFLLLISAGFLTYILWGAVFKLDRDASDSLQPQKAALREHRNRVKSLEKRADAIEQTFPQRQVGIRRRENEIQKLKKVGIVDWEKALEGVGIKLSVYLTGWVQYINAFSLDGADAATRKKVQDSKHELERFKEEKRRKFDWTQNHEE